MNRYLYFHEIKIRLKSFIIWAVSLCLIIFLGMAFYPTFSNSNILEPITHLLDSPFFATIMQMFGIDFASFGHPFGFYLAYLSIYTVLAAMIYAVFLAAACLLSEIKDGTFEYLLARPLNRGRIIFTKIGAMVSLGFALVVLMFFTGWLCLNVFRGEFKGTVDENSRAYGLVVERFESHGDAFRDFFGFKPEDYTDFILNQALSQIDAHPEALRNEGIDEQMVGDLVKMLEQGSPDQLFESVRNDPEGFLSKYNLPVESAEQLVMEINKTENEYKGILSQLENQPARYVEIFKSDPQKYVIKLLELNDSSELQGFDLSARDFKGLIVYFDFSKLVLLNINIFILLFFTLAVTLVISLMVSTLQTALGVSMGFVLGCYLTNAFIKVVPSLAFLEKINPFHLVPSVMDQISWQNLALGMLAFLGLGFGFFALAFLVFQKKDILG
ncbi:MAG: ABC transporter permease subunit [Spirochaetales bacterium]|nr:ABC transporter permease subunit [Spirochaetales bacterium]